MKSFPNAAQTTKFVFISVTFWPFLQVHVTFYFPLCLNSTIHMLVKIKVQILEDIGKLSISIFSPFKIPTK